MPDKSTNLAVQLLKDALLHHTKSRKTGFIEFLFIFFLDQNSDQDADQNAPVFSKRHARPL